jgi:hypothetical protein
MAGAIEARMQMQTAQFTTKKDPFGPVPGAPSMKSSLKLGKRIT